MIFYYRLKHRDMSLTTQVAPAIALCATEKKRYPSQVPARPPNVIQKITRSP